MSKKSIRLFLVSLLAGISLIAGREVAWAAPQAVHKVTICHRTDSVKNPYVRESVDVDSADGNTGNDKGRGDHSQHTGPVATSESQAQSLKNNKQNWGDIIPQHDNYAGLNWTAEGKAVYNNGCKYAAPGRGGAPGQAATSSPANSGTASSTSANPQIAQTPSGGVAAGEGGVTDYNPAAVAGVGGSIAAVVSGAVWLSRRRATDL